MTKNELNDKKPHRMKSNWLILRSRTLTSTCKPSAVALQIVHSKFPPGSFFDPASPRHTHRHISGSARSLQLTETDANKRPWKWSVWQDARQARLLDMALHKPLHHCQPMAAVSGHELLSYCYIRYLCEAESQKVAVTVSIQVSVPGEPVDGLSHVCDQRRQVDLTRMLTSRSAAQWTVIVTVRYIPVLWLLISSYWPD